MTPGWMAIQAGHTGIFISIFTRMLVIHISPVVLMAVNAGENRIVGSVAMAIGASIPFTPVFS